MKVNVEWDPTKARINHRKHSVTFEEATTAFTDPLSSTFLIRCIPKMKNGSSLLGNPFNSGCWWLCIPTEEIAFASSARVLPTHTKGKPMKKQVEIERDPDMLDNYDFSQGVRGKYVHRFAQGSNVVVLSPDVSEIFPDSESVNNALRMLVEIAGRSTGKVPVH
jgi:hypothetical protein